ncbi:lipopolysaccharide biosynthesis protein [Bacteroides reticulotermitis]|uniref:Polysaccharide biosynthesis protein n=2 Tax=Bacteroides reticulotermitis TaxID=1133319 RepID=W4UXP2_9BACE|nr:hypothetical protein [Bacteroides reticulotermitis]MBB4045513.1 O-antigen/teichoic acid export membrane protein [Bacteroides reticulotermitis]GAE85985.1 hypothetical protein JCM10512_4460 [Bacteroides reticulotermitis JCM 10512]
MSFVKNKIFIYLVTRYITYGLQFALSLIIAIRLGPYYLGVYGVVLLVLSYFTQVNFGIPHSLNVLLVQNKKSKKIQDRYTLNSLVIFTYLNIAVVAGTMFFAFFEKDKWAGYDLGKYFLLIAFTAVLTYYNSILTTVIRFRNQVNELSLIGTIPVIANFATVWFFKGENLVMSLTVVNMLSCLVITCICYCKGVIPQFSISDISIKLQKVLINKGLYLFFYNSSFYFILIAVRTIISGNYSVEEFGYFTFSYTIANAVMLMLDSVNTIIFPKTIDMLSNTDNTEKTVVLDKLRVGYITTSHMLIYCALTVFPLLVLIFPKYEPALTSMNMIALTILMNTNSYGYNTLLIAQNKEKISSRISVIALLTTIAIALFLVFIIHVEYSFVIISTLISYMIFSLLATYEGNKILKGQCDFLYTLKTFFPLKLFIPYSLALVISIMRLECIIFLPLLIFIMLNFKDLYFLKRIFSKIVNNPNIIDL